MPPICNRPRTSFGTAYTIYREMSVHRLRRSSGKFCKFVVSSDLSLLRNIEASISAPHTAHTVIDRLSAIRDFSHQLALRWTAMHLFPAGDLNPRMLKVASTELRTFIVVRE